jgi:hypothetical protein
MFGVPLPLIRIPEIVQKTKGLTIGPGIENKDIAPMNNKAALERA